MYMPDSQSSREWGGLGGGERGCGLKVWGRSIGRDIVGGGLKNTDFMYNFIGNTF